MLKLNKLNQSLLSATLVLSAGYASTAAFQLVEVSTSGLGRAYAGDAAIAENASVVAINPALMTQFKRAEISVGGTYIKPDVNLNGKVNSVNGIPVQGYAASGLPLNSDASHRSIAPSAVIPNLYYVHPINDQFAVGGGVNVNYGLKTEFDKNYSAGVFAGTTELTAINFNLSGAYRLNDHWSFGIGFNAVHADALIERHMGIRGEMARKASPALGINESTVAARLEGKEWGFGWNAGVVYEFNERNRIGVAYHSHVDIDFKGKYSNQLPVALDGTGGSVIPGSLTLNLPAYWEVSGYHRLTDKLAASYSYKWTRWSRFQELEARGNDGKQLFHKDEKFKDASRIALGLSYDFSEQFTLRTGIAYDESPVQEGYYSISIPDADRTWLSLGATYRFTPDLSVDIGYSHLIASDNTFTESENGANATFSSKSKANIYGLALNYRF